MTQPTGVFVRLPLSEEQEAVCKHCARHDRYNALIRAIGTPVTGEDLPTAIFRVREHSEDNSNAWAYHKAPPSDQDASEYELEVERLLTHEQAQAQLAARDAEIARLWSALEGIEMGIDALPDDNEDYSRMTAREMRRQALEVVKSEAKALKGGAA